MSVYQLVLMNFEKKVENIEKVIRIFKKFWESLRFFELNKVLRKFQRFVKFLILGNIWESQPEQYLEYLESFEKVWKILWLFWLNLGNIWESKPEQGQGDYMDNRHNITLYIAQTV